MAQLQSRTAEITAPIVQDGKALGRVVILTRTQGVLDRLLASLGISLAAAVAAAAVSVLLAQRLQKAITGPIIALTRSMGEVQADHNYDRTVGITADDEVGELVAGFNRMLSEIRLRDDQIAAQVVGLELEVAERTADYRADAANGAKSDFLATMSHEIRTPMNGMMVMAEMLAAGELPARQRRYADVIAKSGASLLAILNDILDFSKIEAGKLELEIMPVDLAEVAEDVASLFWERAASKGLDLAVYADPATPLKIAGDPTRLRQVIGNLANNAIKFTEAGGVLIEIEPAQGGVRVSVRDTGIGIPQDKIPGLFSAFSQADQSTTRKFGGTGLGLAICKRLVETMGGSFNVTSAVGRGSTFAFLLPAETLEAAPPWPRAAGEGAVAAVRHPGVSTQRALNRYLARAGYIPRDSDGSPAVVLAGAAQLSVNQPSQAPTICLAAYGESQPQGLVRAGAAQAVLVQPFRRRDLAALLGELAVGLPLTDPAAGSDAGTGDTLPAFPDAHVLVADDSAVKREVAMEALGRLGVRVTLVNDGREAVERVLNPHDGERFDLVLMDGSMPEMDGYEATRAIRAAELITGGPALPIVALTAHVVGSAAQAWREAGMDAVLHKPFTLAALAAILGDFLIVGDASVAAERAVEPVAASAEVSDLLDPEVQASLSAMAAGGKPDFVDRIKRLYRDNAPKAAGELVTAARTADAAAGARAAHALKSMSLNIGARAVAGLAAQMEEVAREGRAPTMGEVEVLCRKLEATFVALKPADVLQQNRAAS